VTGKKTSKRGLAAMDPAKRRKICSMGGKAAQSKTPANRFTSETGRVAALKGGKGRRPQRP
jgi:uncharacterized protein